MTKRNPTPPDAVRVAIDMSKHRQEVLIERPEGGRRRRMTVMATKADYDRWVFLRLITMPSRRAGCADGDSRTGGAAEPARAASTEPRHHHLAATGSACSSDQRLSLDTPAARSSPEIPGDARPPLAWQRASPIFCEQIVGYAALRVRPALSSIASASSRLSLAFSASSVRSRFASDTSRPPYLPFQL